MIGIYFLLSLQLKRISAIEASQRTLSEKLSKVISRQVSGVAGTGAASMLTEELGVLVKNDQDVAIKRKL